MANHPETTQASRPTSWSRRLLNSISLLVILAFSVYSGARVFLDAENQALDFFHKLDSIFAEPQVILVVIDKEAYKGQFHSRSPLDANVLRELIEKVAKGNPRIIAIDIDTSDPQFKSLQSLRVPAVLVWARQVEIDDHLKATNPGRAIVPKEVLGSNDQEYTESSGLAVLWDDPNTRLTRRYSRGVDTATGDCLPSLPWAIAVRWKPPSGATYKCPDPANMLSIHFRDENRRRTINASDLLADRVDVSPMEGKIVLLGGTYNDRHYTVAGELYGVQIMANAVETELSGGGWARPSPLSIFVIGLVAWLSVNLLFHYLPFVWAALVALVVIPGSALLFWKIGMVTHLPYVVAILVVLVIYESWETAHERKVFSLSEMVTEKLKRIRSAAK